MNVWSLFSGVGGFDLGLERAGAKVKLQCEIDPWRRSILAAHWPDVVLIEDVQRVADVVTGKVKPTGGPSVGKPDIICGGFPCQDLSVAGKRAGLAGDRSGLFFTFARIAKAVRPRWLLIENVGGLLTSHGGRDFGVLLETLVKSGYSVGWRVLDSQFFGVPQRRRRVFILAHRSDGDPRGASERVGEVLAVSSSCSGDHPEGGSERQEVARALAGRSPSRLDDACVGGGQLVPVYYVEDHINGTLKANGAGGFPRTDRQPLVVTGGSTAGMELAGTLMGKQGGARTTDVETQTFVVSSITGEDLGVSPTLDARAKEGPRRNQESVIIMSPEVADTLTGGGHPNSNMPGRRKEDDTNLVKTYSIVPESGQGADLRATEADTANALTGLNGQAHDRGIRVVEGASVRRLTPKECERLQGFPDDWTLVPGVRCVDSRRYAAVGDAVTVPVIEWIGRRIMENTKGPTT